MKTTRLGGPSAALLVCFAAATCRNFDASQNGKGQNGGTSAGGSSSATGGSTGGSAGSSEAGAPTRGGGEAAMNAGDGGASSAGDGAGGSRMRGGSGSGADGGDSFGEGGYSGHAGEPRGTGGDDRPVPEPGIYGAVRILFAGVPTCGGTLISNSWVLTAAACAPATRPIATMKVGFGMDSNHFEQTREVVEIVRYPGSDLSAPVPDLVLIGVSAPFVLEGSASAHGVLPALASAGGLYGSHRCVGWDLTPDPASPTNRLHAETLACIAVATNDGVERGWFQNSNAFDPEHGALLTSNDLGSGCFKSLGDTAMLTAVHSGIPVFLHDGRPNDDQEASVTGVTQPDIRLWIYEQLFGVDSGAAWTAWGEAAPCSPFPNALDVFSLNQQGRMTWRRQSAWPSSPTLAAWHEFPALEPPAVELARNRPGVLCSPDGSVELFARAVDDSVWWQRFRGGSWEADWTRVPDARATSGLTVAGDSPHRFHVFHRGPDDQLMQGKYDGAFRWQDLGGVFDGTPTVRWAHSEWWEVYAQAGGLLFDHYRFFGAQGWVGPLEPIGSDPAVVSWSDEDVFVFTRYAENKLRWFWYSLYGSPPLLDTRTWSLPPGSLTAVARNPGHFDLVVSEPGQPIWHAIWPRNPTP